MSIFEQMMQNTSSQSINNNPYADFSPQHSNEPLSWEMKENDWNLTGIFGLLKRRALIITGVATIVMAGVTYKTLTQVPQYESSFRLLVEPVKENPESNLSKLTSNVDSDIRNSSLDYDTQIEILKSPELMNDIVRELQQKYPNMTYDNLLQEDGLSIIRLGETKIIEVSYQNNNPSVVKEVLDTVARNYLKYSLEKRQTQLNQGISFVDRELPPIKAEVDKLQQELQNFRQQYNYIDTETQSEQVGEQLQLLAEQRQGVDRQLAEAKANFALLQQEQGALAVLKDAQVYQNLVIQLRELEVKIAEESTRFRDDAPMMQRLREKRQKLMPLLEEEGKRILTLNLSEAQNQVQTLEVQSQQLRAAEQNLSQRIKQFPALARRYAELQQNLQIANESLNRFLTTRQNLQIEAAQTELPWEMIKAPTKPENALSSNNQRNLILGGIASILMGVGAALLIEKLDRTYHNVGTIKDDLLLPLLGVLPFDRSLHQKRNLKAKSSQNRQVEGIPEFTPTLHPESIPSSYFQQSSQFVEALRVIHTNLQLVNSDRQIRSVVVSSPLSGDGKSTVAYNLAKVAASMGQKVLLVDTDLRSPSFYGDPDLSNLLGLSNLIFEDIGIEEVIQELPDISGCSVITSGTIPPNAISLLSSAKMKQLMEEFRQKFDLVIYDTPPLIGLADATLLAPRTDGIILVLRIDRTERPIIKQALDRLKTSRTNVLGVVANGDKSNNYYHS